MVPWYTQTYLSLYMYQSCKIERATDCEFHTSLHFSSMLGTPSGSRLNTLRQDMVTWEVFSWASQCTLLCPRSSYPMPERYLYFSNASHLFKKSREVDRLIRNSIFESSKHCSFIETNHFCQCWEASCNMSCLGIVHNWELEPVPSWPFLLSPSLSNVQQIFDYLLLPCAWTKDRI